MAPVESADARTVLMTMYLERYPPAGIISQQPSRTGVPVGMPAESRPRSTIGREAFLKDETLRRAEDGKILRVPSDQTKGDFGGQGRTIYDAGSPVEPKVCPTLAALARIDAQAEGYASDRLKTLMAGWEEVEREKMEFRGHSGMGGMLLRAPSLGAMNREIGLGVSPSVLSGGYSVLYEPSWAAESNKADEMFDLFINADECADWECMG